MAQWAKTWSYSAAHTMFLWVLSVSVISRDRKSSNFTAQYSLFFKKNSCRHLADLYITAESLLVPPSCFHQITGFSSLFLPCPAEPGAANWRFCNVHSDLLIDFTQRRRWNVLTPGTGRWRDCWGSSCRDNEPRPTEPCGSFLMTTSLSCQRSDRSCWTVHWLLQH